MTARTISAFRVKSTLSKVGTLNASKKIHILARQKGLFSSFFLVSESWEKELESNKNVRVLAQINCSKQTGNAQVEFIDPSLKFSPRDILGLSSFQKSVQSLSI